MVGINVFSRDGSIFPGFFCSCEFRPLCSMNKSLFAFLMFVWNQYYPASIFPWFFIVAIELWSLPSIRFYKKTKATNADLNTFISVMSRLKVQSKVLVFWVWLWPGGYRGSYNSMFVYYYFVGKFGRFFTWFMQLCTSTIVYVQNGFSFIATFLQFFFNFFTGYP